MSDTPTLNYSDLVVTGTLADANETLMVQSVSGTPTVRRASLSTLRGHLVSAGRNITISSAGQISAANGAWLNGDDDPGAGLGNAYDYYIQFPAGDLWQKSGGGTWAVIGNLLGPAGSVSSFSSLNVPGAFSVNTNKFTVNSTSGNTAVAGTLVATGASTLAALSATTGTFSSTATATAFIPSSATVPTNGMYLPAANTLGFAINSAAEMSVTASALSPAVSDGLALGTSALMWSDAFFASGAVLNFNNGDVTITHSADTLTLAGGTLAVSALTATTGVFSSTATATAFIPSSATVPTNGLYLPAANTLGFAINSAAEVQLTSTALSPAVSDGSALGTSSLMWGDLFLASGAVLNFANGDVTITHSSDALAVSGGTVTITRDSTSSTGTITALSIAGAQSVANAAGALQGLDASPSFTAASGNLGTLLGVRGLPINSGAGTVADLRGIVGHPMNASTGTVTRSVGVWVRNDNQNAGGTVTTAYGVYIATPSNAGTMTNKWGLYQEDTASQNFLGGRTLIGAVTDDASTNLQVNGTFKVTGASTFTAALTYGGATLANSVTGTGSMVLSASPALTTPALGTPSAAVLTNATGLPLTTGVTGTLPVAKGGTGVTTSTGTGAVVLSASPILTGTVSTSSLRISGVNVGGYSRASLQTLLTLDNSAAAAFAWNYSGGSGETDLFTNRGNGSTGGLNIYDFPNTTGDPTLIARFTAAGALVLTAGITATTGTFSSTATATAFIPSSSATVPTNGMYLPATNSLAWATNTTEGMRLNATGDLGVGANTPLSRLYVYKDQTSASGNTTNFRVAGSQTVASTGGFYTAQVSGAYTASSGNTLAALYGLLVDPTNYGTGAITVLHGIYSGPQNTGTGTVASLYGVTSIPRNSGAGTVTTAYGILARVDNTNVGGTITSVYGVYIGTPSNAGTIVNNWGLYQENAAAKNAFFGRTLIGSATDDASTNLQVNGTFKVTGASTLAALSATTGAFTGATTVNLSGTAISTVQGLVFGAAAVDGLNTGVVLDAVAVHPRYILRRANGTSASRTAVVLNDTLGALEGRGYDGSAFTTLRAGIDFVAAENWSGVAQGGKIVFRTTTNGSTNGADVKMTLENGGALLIGGTTDDGTNKLRVSGGITVDTGNSYKVNNVAVVGVRKTGWAAATGTATRTTFVTSTVTTAQLAERLKALIDDLISHGLVGA